jgi:hypothetical protein
VDIFLVICKFLLEIEEANGCFTTITIMNFLKERELWINIPTQVRVGYLWFG